LEEDGAREDAGKQGTGKGRVWQDPETRKGKEAIRENDNLAV